MAFSAYVKDDQGLVRTLERIHAEKELAPNLNLLRASTLGLLQVRGNIDRQMTQPPPGLHTNQHGHLMLSTSLPTLGQRYTLLTEVGHGTFSRIFMADNRGGSRYRDNQAIPSVAVKVIKTGYSILGLREASFLQYFNSKTLRGSKHFVGIYEIFQYEQHLCLVLDLCKGTLYDLMKSPMEEGWDSNERHRRTSSSSRNIMRTGDSLQGAGADHHNEVRVLNMTQRHLIDFEKIRKISLSLASALAIMHEEGVIHADIKPENCLLVWPDQDSESVVKTVNSLPEDFQVRLGDFGNAMHTTEAAASFEDFEVQTLGYRAPEVLLGVPFDQQIDTWSLGIMLLELCLGKSLFLGKERGEMLSEITRKLVKLPLNCFEGGRFFGDYYANYSTIEGFWIDESNTSSNSTTYFACLLVSIKNMLSESVGNVPPDFTHFLAGLLHPDPSRRLSSLEAVAHPFLSGTLPIPLSFLVSRALRPAPTTTVGIPRPRAVKKEQPPLAATSKDGGRVASGGARGRLAGPSSTLMSLHDGVVPAQPPKAAKTEGEAPAKPSKSKEASDLASPSSAVRGASRSDGGASGRGGRAEKRRDKARARDKQPSSLPKELKDLLEQNSAYADEVPSSEEEDEQEQEQEQEQEYQGWKRASGGRKESDDGEGEKEEAKRREVEEEDDDDDETEEDIDDEDTASLDEAQLGPLSQGQDEDEGEGEDESEDEDESEGGSLEAEKSPSPAESRPRERVNAKRGARAGAAAGDSLLGALTPQQPGEEPKPKKQKRSKGKVSALAQLESMY
jgi:serine/threonine protein kinase